MFTGPEIETVLAELGVTHVVWVPDTAIGPWEKSLVSSSRLRLIRVCREGEAWPLAAGLHLGGQTPLVVMQTTGLFESGDALAECVVRFEAADLLADRRSELVGAAVARLGKNIRRADPAGMGTGLPMDRRAG